jgi:hypothetical protein
MCGCPNLERPDAAAFYGGGLARLVFAELRTRRSHREPDPDQGFALELIRRL